MLDFIATVVVIMIVAVFIPVILTGLLIIGSVPLAIILFIIGMFRKTTN